MSGKRSSVLIWRSRYGVSERYTIGHLDPSRAPINGHFSSIPNHRPYVGQDICVMRFLQISSEDLTARMTGFVTHYSTEFLRSGSDCVRKGYTLQAARPAK